MSKFWRAVRQIDYLAVTSHFSDLVVGQIAKDRFKVPCVVVRCFDPNRARFFSERGLNTISPVSLTVDKIHETISEYRGEAKKR